MKIVLLCLLRCRPCVASRGATAARARYATASTIVPFRPAYQRLVSILRQHTNAHVSETHAANRIEI